MAVFVLLPCVRSSLMCGRLAGRVGCVLLRVRSTFVEALTRDPVFMKYFRLILSLRRGAGTDSVTLRSHSHFMTD